MAAGVGIEWLPYLAFALAALAVLVGVGLVAAGRGDPLAPLPRRQPSPPTGTATEAEP